MERIVTIYGLIDPRDGLIRYVGKTVKKPKERLKEHFREANRGRNTLRLNWIRKLFSLSLAPFIVVLDEVPENIWEKFEIVWIKILKDSRFPLLNGTFGGDAPTHLSGVESHWYGRKHTDETLYKLRESRKGKKPNLGKAFDESWRCKMSEAHKGIHAGEKHPLAKLTASQVLSIRNTYIKGDVTHKELAEQYGLSRQYIGDLINRKNWKHL